MSQARTKKCQHCGAEFEYQRSTALFCSKACKKKAMRLRRAKPVSLERTVKSQRRSSRRHDAHVQRPQQLSGQSVISLGTREVKESPGETGRKRTEAGGWASIEWADKTFEEAARLLSESPEGRFTRLRDQAEAEFVWYVLGGFKFTSEYSDGIPTCRHEDHARDDRCGWRLTRWVVRWRNFPGLTPTERQKIIRHAALGLEEFKADRRRDKEASMELATVAAQNEEILARLKALQHTADETFARVAETVERTRERFPNDAEVSAAVDRFLDEIETA